MMPEKGRRNTGTRLQSLRLPAALILAAGLYAAGASHAQYPVKPIRLVVVIAPGGGRDVAARVMQGPLSEALGPIVITRRLVKDLGVKME